MRPGRVLGLTPRGQTLCVSGSSTKLAPRICEDDGRYCCGLTRSIFECSLFSPEM